MFTNIASDVSMYWIRNLIGSFPMCFFISTYMMRSLSIGILNWIGVYPRSCIFSKISKLVSMYWIRNLIRSSLISFLNSE